MYIERKEIDIDIYIYNIYIYIWQNICMHILMSVIVKPVHM